MWNEINPAALYLNTTWELITTGKYIQSGSTALQTGGSNSVSITKANLPNIALKVNSFSLTTQPHTHVVKAYWGYSGNASLPSFAHGENNNLKSRTSESGGGQNTGTASPSTETLGSGTALSIQPAYITLKFWKRLT